MGQPWSLYPSGPGAPQAIRGVSWRGGHRTDDTGTRPEPLAAPRKQGCWGPWARTPLPSRLPALSELGPSPLERRRLPYLPLPEHRACRIDRLLGQPTEPRWWSGEPVGSPISLSSWPPASRNLPEAASGCKGQCGISSDPHLPTSQGPIASSAGPATWESCPVRLGQPASSQDQSLRGHTRSNSPGLHHWAQEAPEPAPRYRTTSTVDFLHSSWRPAQHQVLGKQGNQRRTRRSQA